MGFTKYLLMRNFYSTFLKIFVPFVLILSIYVYSTFNAQLKLIENSYSETLSDYWGIIANFYYKDKNSMKGINDKIIHNDDILISLFSSDGNFIYDHYFSKDILPIPANLSKKDLAIVNEYPNGHFFINKYKNYKNYRLYYIKKLKDGNILRISMIGIIYQKFFEKAFSDILKFLGIFSFLFFIISLYITYKLSRPISQLLQVSNAIMSNDPTPLPKIVDPIVNNAVEIMDNMHKQLIEEKKALEIKSSTLSSILENINEIVILISSDNILLNSNNNSEDSIFNVKKGDNLLQYEDYELRNFFDEIINSEESVFRKVYKNNFYDIYTVKIENNRLIVLHDISALADYEDFKAELTANVAHEIKTPVAIIMSASEILGKDKNISESIRDKFLDKIFTSSLRLSKIINQTLELYTMENKGIYIEEKTDVDKIISDIVLLNSEKEIIYENLVTRSFNVDSFHFEMILTNLINNAIKYSKGDKIFVKIYNEDNTLIGEVIDMGPAIPEKEIKRIFERFYTVSKSRNQSGFGLGLSIVKHICLLYRGNAKAFENEYHGNTFQFSLKEIDL